jgi:hypothetical protein
MKTVLLRSLFVALLIGPLTTFVDVVTRTHHTHRYEPPVSEAELQQLSEGSVAHFRAELEKRQVPFTCRQWLEESVGQHYFWNSLAKSSLVPTVGVFLACVCVGGLERRELRRSVASHPVG